VVLEQFFEDVNNILNSGDIPGLYNHDDLDNIFVACKVDCQRKNIPATRLNSYAQFLTRIKHNLHVVLCMSPMGESFRTRLRMFPSLVNCCTIDWYAEWPSDALENVATTQLKDSDLKLPNIPAIVRVFQAIHQSVARNSTMYREQLRRYNYVTPTSFLELITMFKTLLNLKREQVGGLRSKLQYGLDTIHTSSAMVTKLQVDLQEKQPQLVTTRERALILNLVVCVSDRCTKRCGEHDGSDHD
jgi:dynein heavy chain